MRMWCGTVHGRWSWPALCFSLKETTKRQLLIDSSFQTQSYSHLEESERKKPVRLTHAIPGESKTLEYESNLTLEQSDVAKKGKGFVKSHKRDTRRSMRCHPDHTCMCPHLTVLQ
ncbi:hypothetical protein YC2023_103967 [Brassica napus]